MSRFAWLTDLHLDQVDDNSVKKFADGIATSGVDGILLSGDISNSRQFIQHLAMFEAALSKPIIFVLGNHDYWFSSIEKVQKSAVDISTMSTFIKWAASTPYIALSQSTAVVGHDGWYDALEGPPDFSVGMNDWQYIGDFVPPGTNLKTFVNPSKDSIVSVSRALSHKAATHVMHAIKAATRYHKHIIVLTHVPPFKCHDQDAVGASWYTSKMMGDMLIQAARTYPNIQFTVLCGHTHSRGSRKVDKNLVCYTGEAVYGKPTVENILEVK